MADLNKLALISPVLLDRLMDRLVQAEAGRNKSQPDMNINAKVSENAAERMNEVLESDTPPSKKVKIYNKALNDFRNQVHKTTYHNDQSDGVSDIDATPVLVSHADSQTTDTTPVPVSHADSQTDLPAYLAAINSDLTPTQQQKANGILSYINKNDDIIRVDHNGAVYIDDQVVEGGKITDIVVGGVRNLSKSHEIPGQVQLFEILVENGMPKTLIGNAALKSKLKSQWLEN